MKNDKSHSISVVERKAPKDKASESTGFSRLVPMDAVRNLRDLGGYKAIDGKTVAFGRIYRSASLYNATLNDIEYMLSELSIKHIIDFRNASETIVEHEPKQLLKEASYHWLPIMVEGTTRDDIIHHLKQEHPERENFSELLVKVNHRLALEHQDDFKAWFAILLQEEPAFLFHCTEGKDRTGFAAALLLSALGVDREAIFTDYLLTNTVNAESIEERIQNSRVLSLFQVDVEQLKRLLMAHEDYLQAAFTAIDLHYGSIENYLDLAMGLNSNDINILRDKFLV